MQLTSVEKSSQRKKSDVVIVPFWQGKSKPESACKEEEFSKWAAQPIRNGDFGAKEGETLLLYRTSGKEHRILLLGLGKRKPCLAENLRKSYASAVKALRAKKIKTANVFLPENELLSEEVILRGAAEGALLANYSFSMLKSDSGELESQNALSHLCFVGVDRPGSSCLKKLHVVSLSVNLARDLINGNADDVHVDTLAAFARGISEEFSTVKTTILGKEDLERENLGLILAVNRGSVRDPALIILEYQGNPGSKDKTAVIGKGITYDTGGLNMKPTGSMETMKCDMSGAAAALCLVQAAARLKLKKNIVAALAVAENAVGPNSYKPGDVFKSHAGKTVEISNTDAEGRLVLADAFSYIQEKYHPNRLIDLATLTGAIVVALGEEATGLFCNDDILSKELMKAGDRTHERLWRMPLFPEYKEMLKSKIADLKNSAGRGGGSCTAAAFLQQFVKEIPWAHLDIAGTAYLSDAKGYHTTPATGVGVRLLIDYLEHLEA